MPTRYNTARKALDDAMARSCNLQELKANLRSMGYQQLCPKTENTRTITMPDGRSQSEHTGWVMSTQEKLLSRECSAMEQKPAVFASGEGYKAGSAV